MGCCIPSGHPRILGRDDTKLFCTDPACDAVYEAIGRLEELACFCGGGLEIVGFPDHSSADRGGFELLPLAA